MTPAQLESLMLAIEDGDGIAEMAIRDYYEENGGVAEVSMSVAKSHISKVRDFKMEKAKNGKAKSMVAEVEPIVEVGKIVGVLTVTQLYSGRVASIDHEFITLAPNAVQVFETGDFKTFYGENIADLCMQIPVQTSIRRGCIISISSWLHDTPPTQRQRT